MAATRTWTITGCWSLTREVVAHIRCAGGGERWVMEPAHATKGPDDKSSWSQCTKSQCTNSSWSSCAATCWPLSVAPSLCRRCVTATGPSHDAINDGSRALAHQHVKKIAGFFATKVPGVRFKDDAFWTHKTAQARGRQRFPLCIPKNSGISNPESSV